jgi:hypothetical protein
MKVFLKKLLIQNLMSTSASLKTRNLIIWILYPEVRNNQVNLETVRVVKKFVIFSFTLVLLTTTIFSLGYLSHLYKSLDTYNQSIKKSSVIDSLNKSTSKKDSLIKGLREVTISRDYWNWKIINETGIKEILAFKKLPDSIVFESLNQCELLDIPIKIFFRIMERESRFQFVSNKTGSGAFGYMQVMPGTFRIWQEKLKLSGGHTPKNNILVSANLISSCFKFWSTKFKNKNEAWRWTLAEYACGREPLLKLGRIPDEVVPGIQKILK